jgi:hypothetical protein
MTDSPRWERESQEDLRPSEQEPQPTTELEIRLFDHAEAGELREPRLLAARESLSATRDSVGESLSATRESLSATATKVGRWLHSLDRRPEFDLGAGRDPVAELTSGTAPADRVDPAPVAGAAPAAGAKTEGPETETPPMRARDRHEGPERRDDQDSEDGVRFSTAPLGYNRQAVDLHIAGLEEEIAALCGRIDPPVSINEEIERLGEQTASILVVAHDKAHETARRAQQQAARAVSEAAEEAERITTAAERRLRELDEETDAVWRERERLLTDVREVSRTLATLADAAAERCPAAPEPSAPQPAPVAAE